MSVIVEEDFKRWTAKRKAALVMDIIQGKTSIAEASRSFDLPPSEIEEWVEEGKRGMETPFGLSPWMSKSNMNGSSKSCRRRTERPCLNFVPEKS